MTITVNGDTVNYDRGTVKSTAEMVAVVNADGTALAGSNTAPVVSREAVMSTSDLTSAVLAITTATTTAIVAAAASETTRVHRVRINVGAAQQITVANGATTLEVLNFTAAGFLLYEFATRPWYVTSANTALNFVTTTTGAVNGVVEYIRSA